MSQPERVIAGRYRLLAPLGEGGMGTVWRARDEVLGREVAVKEVRAPAGLPAAEAARLYARLERQAWAAARIPHRNVVTVHDVATEEGRPWIVMELVRGLSLSDVLDAEGALPPRRAARVGAEVLAALRAAHDAGVLHRDVKPGNVLIANDGRVVLTDFGIATVEGGSAPTMTGEVVGSPEFLAPERALGQRPGPASDLWSLGVLLYAAVEGSSPFRRETPLSTLRAVVDEELPPARAAGPLTPVVEGLLRKDPAERMPAADAERDLRLIVSGGRPLTETRLAGTPQAEAPPPHPPAATAGGGPSAPAPPAAGPAATASDTTTAEPPRSRRTMAALIAGLVALALALGGLTYALVTRDDGDGGSSTGDGSDGGGSGGGTTPPPARTVKVHAPGARTPQYEGPCSPTAGQAPSFMATFAVGRVPAAVEYRWATKTGEPGEPGEPGWKTLDFPAGSGKSKQVSRAETAYDQQGGTRTNAIGVRVRAPAGTASNAVAYSVTREQETPAGGGSCSPYASVQPAGVRPPR
ncbi:serine/threonine protein kinase [Streptomyces sp. G44]|uniref:serine/threonine-protein kinase n=1 Tax=Streptomyces sp. G44 TaxID=2807632 RepID=UPI00195F7BE1|nr:serine/threonine-protein kinase [Streptomyces sp. G44]MBM7170833.1 serine/threonine protein kinase [Streptomyces sp. G44]